MVTNIINLRDLLVTKLVVVLVVLSLLLSAFPVAFFVASAQVPDEMEERELVVDTLIITNPGTDDETLAAGLYIFEAEYIDHDDIVDQILWSIRFETCDAGTATIVGNVDGFSHEYTFVNSQFAVEVDMTDWETGRYCLVVNPSEQDDELDLREVRWFLIGDDAENGSPAEPAEPVIPVCDQGLNLIENGSFENPVISQDADGWDIFDSVVNGLVWVVSWLNPTAESPAVAKLELQNFFSASEGNQYAELDANFISGGAEFEGEDSRVVISQNIVTIPGHTYSIQFDFSAIPTILRGVERGVDGSVENNRMNVLVNGDVVRTVEADGTGNDDTEWNAYTVTFVATAQNTEIAFADAGLIDTFGTWLDNVRVHCVGEDGNGGNEAPTPSRSGGGYAPGERPSSAPEGEVLGDSTSLPEGEVLGDQVTVVPTGAPNTGAGGMNYYVVALALALAAFATRRFTTN